MADGKLRAAILVVSDTASQDPSTDKVGDTLTASFTAEGSNSWDPPVIKIVPDNVLDIQRTICNWTDGPDWFNLVLISGGTGFAVKDNTPEVCSVSLGDPSEKLMTCIGCIASHPSPCAWHCVSRLSELLITDYGY